MWMGVAVDTFRADSIRTKFPSSQPVQRPKLVLVSPQGGQLPFVSEQRSRRWWTDLNRGSWSKMQPTQINGVRFDTFYYQYLPQDNQAASIYHCESTNQPTHLNSISLVFYSSGSSSHNFVPCRKSWMKLVPQPIYTQPFAPVMYGTQYIYGHQSAAQPTLMSSIIHEAADRHSAGSQEQKPSYSAQWCSNTGSGWRLLQIVVLVIAS